MISRRTALLSTGILSPRHHHDDDEQSSKYYTLNASDNIDQQQGATGTTNMDKNQCSVVTLASLIVCLFAYTWEFLAPFCAPGSTILSPLFLEVDTNCCPDLNLNNLSAFARSIIAAHSVGRDELALGFESIEDKAAPMFLWISALERNLASHEYLFHI